MSALGTRVRQPSDIAQRIKHFCRLGTRVEPRLTFLLGAGFSYSAGIPTAGRIVKDDLTGHPLLASAPSCPAGTSMYTHLMSQLPAVERMRIIRQAIDRARPGGASGPQINWAHLLLATLVEAGYVRRILTTNFDPLVVDALALLGLPAQAFDLTASQRFTSGILRPGSVVYLHGQSHGLWLSNVPEELEPIRIHVREVLQDALSDSTLVVVGYSGDCDPVFEELRDSYRQFPYDMYWVHYDPTGAEVGAAVKAMLESPASGAYLVTGRDADSFMRALVVDALGLTVPTLIQDPLRHLLAVLGRVQAYPSDRVVVDPVESARHRVTRAIAREAASGPDLETPIAVAAMRGDQPALDALAANVAASGTPSEQEVLARAYLHAASDALEAGDVSGAERALEQAERIGTTDPWLPTLRGGCLAVQAAIAREASEADELFRRAAAHYAQALETNPEFHEALNNWAGALLQQSRTKAGDEARHLRHEALAKYEEALRLTPRDERTLFNLGEVLVDEAKAAPDDADADRAFERARQLYAEALRTKPDLHEALNSWGTTYAEQSKRRRGREATALLELATQKYAEALAVKPDKDEAFYNWGTALLELARHEPGRGAARLYRQAAEKLQDALQIRPNKDEALHNLGTVLAEWARCADSEADRLFQRAIACFAAALRLKPDKAHALYGWAGALAGQAMRKPPAEADTLFRAAYEKYAGALEAKPNFPEALNAWGTALAEHAKIKEGSEATDLFRQARSTFESALQMEPGSYGVLSNWGSALIDQARKAAGGDAERLLTEAVEKLEQALKSRPDAPEALNNLGSALFELARSTPGEAAEALFVRASETFALAAHANPGDYVALSNWGNVLAAYANTKNSAEAGRLYQEACERYAEALRVQPDHYEALFYWGLCLARQGMSGGEADQHLAVAAEKLAAAIRVRPGSYQALSELGLVLLLASKTKSGADAEALLKESLAALTGALELKPDLPNAAFNAACVEGHLGHPERAVSYLRRWVALVPPPHLSRIESDRDFDQVRDAPAFRGFVNSLGD